METPNLEQIFDEELWMLIERLNNRDLRPEEAQKIIQGFSQFADSDGFENTYIDYIVYQDDSIAYTHRI